jgi:hypothetical protein
MTTFFLSKKETYVRKKRVEASVKMDLSKRLLLKIRVHYIEKPVINHNLTICHCTVLQLCKYDIYVLVQINQKLYNPSSLGR